MTFSIHTLLVAALVAARVAPLFLLGPLAGGRLGPGLVRIGAALALVAALVPALAPTVPDDTGLLAAAALFVKEGIIGVLLAFLAAVPLWAAESAGHLVDHARGGEELASFTLVFATALFFTMDGHLLVVRALASSYEALPLTGPPVALGRAGDLAIAASAQVILAALGLAAPVIAALVLAEIAIALVTRVSSVPAGLAPPVKSLLGVFVTMIALTAFALALRGELAQALRGMSAL